MSQKHICVVHEGGPTRRNSSFFPKPYRKVTENNKNFWKTSAVGGAICKDCWKKCAHPASDKKGQSDTPSYDSIDVRLFTCLISKVQVDANATNSDQDISLQSDLPLKKRKHTRSDEKSESSHLNVNPESSENSHSLPPWPLDSGTRINRMESYSVTWTPNQDLNLPIPEIENENKQNASGFDSSGPYNPDADYIKRFVWCVKNEWIVCSIRQKPFFYKGLNRGKYGVVILLGPKRSQTMITHVLKITEKNQEVAILRAIKMSKYVCVEHCNEMELIIKPYKPIKINSEWSHICTTYGGMPLSCFSPSFRTAKHTLLLIFIASRLLEQDGIYHMDLHSGNILVLPEPGFYVVKGNTKTYSIPTSFRIMIIDFGHVHFSDSTFDRAEMAGSLFLMHISRNSLSTISLKTMQSELENYVTK